jgi:hypothetical protein
MVNEVLQWVALLLLAFFVLGLLRQVGLALPVEHRITNTSGPSVGRKLPRRLWAELERRVALDNLGSGMVLAFVTENCVTCQRLLANLRDVKDRHAVMLLARDPSAQFRSALIETGVSTIYDDGTLWEECDITATPLVVKVDREGRVVAKEVTHRVDSAALTAS